MSNGGASGHLENFLESSYVSVLAMILREGVPSSDTPLVLYHVGHKLWVKKKRHQYGINDHAPYSVFDV